MLKFLLIILAFLLAYIMVCAKDWWDDMDDRD